MDSTPQKPSGPPKPDKDSNYDAPALAALRRVWEDFCEEIAAPEDVVNVIAEVGNFSYFEFKRMEQQIEQGVSDPESEPFATILEAFEILIEACEVMMLEFSEEIPEGMEEPEEGFFVMGFDMVQEATNQMMDGHSLGMKHIEEMAEVNCPFCHHINSRENPKCDKCGRTLPVQSGGQSGQNISIVEHQGLEKKQPGSEGELTKNYHMAAHLLEGWKQEAVSAEQLSEFLDGLEKNFCAHLQDTNLQEQMIGRAPQNQRPALLEALELTRRGLNMSLASVEKMRQAFELEDDRYLFFGLSDLEEASRVMIEAYWANKEAAKN